MQSQTKVEHDATIKFCLVEEKKGLPKLDTKLTDWYQKHWGVRLHAAKCNLGKVNLEVMLVESFSNYARGGQTPLAGAPCFLVVLRSVFTRFLLLAWHFGAVFFFPYPPTLFSSGPGKYWLGSIPLNSSVWQCLGGATRRVAVDTSFLVLEHCLAPQTL